MRYDGILEEELKNRIATDFFQKFDCNRVIGKIDFCAAPKSKNKLDDYNATDFFDHRQSFFWAEAKKGKVDIYKSIVQLVLTIGKARTFDEHLPPLFLGAFDFERIAFIPYGDISEIFYLNDFNWNVTSSDHNSKEFKIISGKVEEILDQKSLVFNLERDSKELVAFIAENFVQGADDLHKVRIDKNNFMVVYNKWLQEVKPSITLDWKEAQKQSIIDGKRSIIDGDFYLADLLSQDNKTLQDMLSVILEVSTYKLDKQIDSLGLSSSKEAQFNDGQRAHTQFWNRYERPPKEEYWDYIIERRDLLVPQDVRERKGSFFTPQIWVELSQKYIADVLGEDWQKEYYVWDCAAGTGNLLAGLTNEYNIFASTLDQQDVDVMFERIDNGANLLKSHVFQFDFLNDDFSKAPQALQEIINDPEKRKKLVVYINPPYAEADNRKGEGRSNVAVSMAHKKYSKKMGYGKRELYIQFLIRIFEEFPSCIIGEFSKLKALQAPAFKKFRQNFNPALKKCFIVPANTFDNVKGDFPIGFKVWYTASKNTFKKITATLFSSEGIKCGKKTLWCYDEVKLINDWTLTFIDKKTESLANIIGVGNDFQHQNTVCIETPNKPWNHQYQWQITKNNIIQSSIYLSVRHCIAATWLNDRDQFLFPKASWEKDTEFQNNCLAYTLFHGQNRITSKEGVNHWIPFTEKEVNAQEKFASNFMTDFICGKASAKELNNEDLLEDTDLFSPKKPLEFSAEAKAVFTGGCELWSYYHQMEGVNVNASYYDIREYFQGRNEKGRLNPKSDNVGYNSRLAALKKAMEALRLQIVPKVYEHGFLKD